MAVEAVTVPFGAESKVHVGEGTATKSNQSQQM